MSNRFSWLPETLKVTADIKAPSTSHSSGFSPEQYIIVEIPDETEMVFPLDL